jgi:hypothetical protein
MALLGLSAAYFTTINSIKVKLAEKAEAALVETIDKKLAGLEVMINFSNLRTAWSTVWAE